MFAIQPEEYRETIDSTDINRLVLSNDIDNNRAYRKKRHID